LSQETKEFFSTVPLTFRVVLFFVFGAGAGELCCVSHFTLSFCYSGKVLEWMVSTTRHEPSFPVAAAIFAGFGMPVVLLFVRR
jgi:hypothetical protein